jgi:hypothetical protein
MGKIIEEYKSYSTRTLRKLATVKTGDELYIIHAVLASRVEKYLEKCRKIS